MTVRLKVFGIKHLILSILSFSCLPALFPAPADFGVGFLPAPASARFAHASDQSLPYSFQIKSFPGDLRGRN